MTKLEISGILKKKLEDNLEAKVLQLGGNWRRGDFSRIDKRVSSAF